MFIPTLRTMRPTVPHSLSRTCTAIRTAYAVMDNPTEWEARFDIHAG